MRRKNLIMLLAFVGTVMIFGSAESFHKTPANPDPEQRPAHAVNEDCRVVQHSEYHTAKVLCRDDLIAIIDERDSSELQIVGVVHHHADGTVHAWIDSVFADTGVCKGTYEAVSTVEEMDTLLHQGATKIKAKEAFKLRYKRGI